MTLIIVFKSLRILVLQQDLKTIVSGGLSSLDLYRPSTHNRIYCLSCLISNTQLDIELLFILPNFVILYCVVSDNIAYCQ